jgi:hypothetical protein
MGAQRYEIYLRVFKLDTSRVRYRAWTQEDKFTSPSVHVLFYLLYKHFTQIQKKNRGNCWLTKTWYQHMWKIIVSKQCTFLAYLIALADWPSSKEHCAILLYSFNSTWFIWLSSVSFCNEHSSSNLMAWKGL